MTSQSRLTAIVLSYNGSEYLHACLDSINNQSCPACPDYQLIVVDNGSTDQSISIIRSLCPDALLVTLDKNQGFCQGMNIGIQKSEGELILLLNQDIVLEKECFQNLLETWDNPPPDNLIASSSGKTDRPLMGVFPKVTFYDSPKTINAFGVDWFEDCHWRDSRVGLFDSGAFEQAETVFGSIFPAVLMHRQRFLDMGSFDSLFWSYCEDFDVCYRTNILGFRFVTSPGAIIQHKYRASSRDTVDPLWSRYWFIRNYLLVFLKNYEAVNLFKYGRKIYRRYLGNVWKNARHTKNREELKMCRRIALDLIRNIPTIVMRRRFIQKNRQISDEALWSKSFPVEDHNIFHVENCPVLSLLSLRCARGEFESYMINDVEYFVR